MSWVSRSWRGHEKLVVEINYWWTDDRQISHSRHLILLFLLCHSLIKTLLTCNVWLPWQLGDFTNVYFPYSATVSFHFIFHHSICGRKTSSIWYYFQVRQTIRPNRVPNLFRLCPSSLRRNHTSAHWFVCFCLVKLRHVARSNIGPIVGAQNHTEHLCWVHTPKGILIHVINVFLCVFWF